MAIVVQLPIPPGSGESPTQPEDNKGDIFTIGSGVVLGSVVYLSAADTVSLAYAADSGMTDDAMGVVVELPTPTTARVVPRGLSGTIFSGLVTGQTYYLSDATPGEITNTAPSASGSKIQEIGRAVSATELYIDVDPTSVIL